MGDTDAATGLAVLACLVLLALWCISGKPRKHVGPVSDADADDTPDDADDPERVDL